MANRAKFLAFSCVHFPLHHEEFRQWRLEKIREHKPDVVVNLGDWFDADYASRWDNENEWSPIEEWNLVAQDAREIREAAGPRAKLVWLEGNHCANPREPGRLPKRLRATIQFAMDTIIRPAVEDWTIIPYKHDAYYRLGQVTFQHGSQTNLNAERDQSLMYGVPFGLHVSGHTHRPVPVTRVILPGKVPVFGMQYCNVGCGADWTKMRYIQRSNHQLWGRAVLVGDCNARQRRAWFGSKQWDAELKIHSMASDRG